MSNIFNRTGGLKPGRSVFDLSYSRLFDCGVGQLIPVMCDELVPGDVFEIANECVVRMNPMVAPMLHEMDVSVHYFAVPIRLLWPEPNGWETFITGGPNGTDFPTIPRWDPGGVPSKGSLWDYFGFPLVRTQGLDAPIIFPCRAYYAIWNEWYRDETQETKQDITAINGGSDYPIYNRNWRKDYFTSALPWQQRGTAPALPVSGTTSAVWPAVSGVADFNFEGNTAANVPSNTASGIKTRNLLNNNVVSLASATSVSISELRTSVQVQKFLERNARAGARYIESLKEHFGAWPRDERLQRPEYIGGTKQAMIVSEVLQTSKTDVGAPQGTMAGHGLSASMGGVTKYRAQEHMLVMGIFSIMPKAVYASQGFDRQWLRRTKLDYYWPEFAHTSEQAIEREEIYATTVLADNRTTWGYQGRYDEYRVKKSGVMNNFRDTLAYWHMARTFAAAPVLNAAFMNCVPTDTSNTRIFAVPAVPGYMVHFGNRIRANRPIPALSEPGMMDHF